MCFFTSFVLLRRFLSQLSIFWLEHFLNHVNTRTASLKDFPLVTQVINKNYFQTFFFSSDSLFIVRGILGWILRLRRKIKWNISIDRKGLSWVIIRRKKGRKKTVIFLHGNSFFFLVSVRMTTRIFLSFRVAPPHRRTYYTQIQKKCLYWRNSIEILKSFIKHEAWQLIYQIK